MKQKQNEIQINEKITTGTKLYHISTAIAAVAIKNRQRRKNSWLAPTIK
jgi:hypothetical protein